MRIYKWKTKILMLTNLSPNIIQSTSALRVLRQCSNLARHVSEHLPIFILKCHEQFYKIYLMINLKWSGKKLNIACSSPNFTWCLTYIVYLIVSATTAANRPGSNMTVTEEHLRMSLLSAVEDKMKRRLREIFEQAQVFIFLYLVKKIQRS